MKALYVVIVLVSVVTIVAAAGPLAAAGGTAAALPSGAPRGETRTPRDLLRTGPGFIVENAGQIPNRDVRLYYAAGGLQVGFARSALLAVLGPAARGPETGPRVLVHVQFRGSSPTLPEAQGGPATRVTYLTGNQPGRGSLGVPGFRQVAYRGLYPHIDLVYRVERDGLKYEFEVHPGGDPAQIAVGYEGIEGLGIDGDGSLRVRTAVGDLRDLAPVAYQDAAHIPCRFALLDGASYGFRCGRWDPSRALVIDPLMYATYLGGSGFDWAFSVAVDGTGAAYVTGRTASPDFPVTPGAFSTTYRGADVFVAKLDPAGALVYATFLGGSGNDTGSSIAVDAAGNAYVAGRTTSPDFPTTMGAFNTIYNGGTDAFVAKLDAAGGALAYSSYLGGTRYDSAAAIAVDATADAYVTGRTTSADFPATAGAYDTTYNGVRDAWVAKLDPRGMPLYATFLGGSNSDAGASIAVDAAGDAYVSGRTNSTSFPTTAGAYDTTYNGGTDAFVAKLSPGGASLRYATFLGGSGYDPGDALAVDAAGNAYVASRTNSTNFPVTAGAFDRTYGGGSDAFVAKLDPAGSALAFSTLLGGSAYDSADSIAVDAGGNASVTGHTNSTDFPTTLGAHDSAYGGVNDTFVARLDAQGGALTYATFLGGAGSDAGESIALGPTGDAYVTGRTDSTGFPTTLGAFDASYNGGTDAFLVRLTPAAYPVTVDTAPTGLQVQVAGITYTAPHTFWCGSDSPVPLNAPSPQALPAARYAFASWSDGGAQAHGIACRASATYTATFMATDFLVTAASSPQGLQVQLDGTTATAPTAFWCPAGSTHALNAPSPQVAATTRYGFLSWSDGGAQAHAIACDAPRTYTAAFAVTDYLITLDTIPSGLQLEIGGAPVTAPNQSWCPAGSTPTVNAPSPQGGGPSRDVFASWSDGGTQAHAIACDAAGTYTATFVAQYRVTIDTSPAGLVVQADGGWFVAPASFWWNASSRHRIAANATQAGLNFAFWSDGGGISHTVTVLQAATILANYTASPVPLTLSAEAIPTGGQVPLSVNFTAVAWGGHPPYAWWWTFGDGTGSSAQEPSHVFPRPGTYTVTVQVNDTGSPRNTTMQQIQIAAVAPPLILTATANVTQGPAPLRVQFVADASGGVPPYAWWWTFGDGTGSATSSPVHVFAGPGVYTVSVQVNDTGSPRSTTAKELRVIVTPAPLALTGCTVAPDPLELRVGDRQRFTAFGWDGTSLLAGTTTAWSVTGGVGTIDALGTFTATGPGAGAVDALVSYNGTSMRCAASVTVRAAPAQTMNPLLWLGLAAVAVGALVAFVLLIAKRRRSPREEPGTDRVAPPRPRGKRPPPARGPPRTGGAS